MYNYDVSTLFSSLNNSDSNSLSSLNFSEYASIQNGSYGKLVKTYYAKQKESSDSGETSSAKSKKDTQTDTTGLSKLKSEADGLSKAADALSEDNLWKTSSGSTATDKMVSAVKGFVNEYNDTITQAGKVSSKDVSTSVKYMSDMTTTMSKSLSKIGISVATDGTLSLSEDELKKASVNNIKSLFTGSVSYGSQISDKANEISKNAVMSSSIYSENGTLNSALSGLFNSYI